MANECDTCSGGIDGSSLYPRKPCCYWDVSQQRVACIQLTEIEGRPAWVFATTSPTRPMSPASVPTSATSSVATQPDIGAEHLIWQWRAVSLLGWLCILFAVAYVRRWVERAEAPRGPGARREAERAPQRRDRDLRVRRDWSEVLTARPQKGNDRRSAEGASMSREGDGRSRHRFSG